MDYITLLGVLAVLLVVLALLAVWQRQIDEHHRNQAAEHLSAAHAGGSSVPIAQHPQIDPYACIGCGSCIEACPEENVLGLVDGVAKVIHGARCIGHGRCADACPVAAVTIGLGDTSGRTDLPVLSEQFETTVPGVYIAGELGGMALIRIAVEQGARAIDAIAERLASAPEPESDAVDVLIVGAGPAGFAASLRAIERGLSYITIDQDDIGGTVRKYPRRKLTLTGPVQLPLYGRVAREEFLKEELIEFWEKIVARFGLRVRSGVKLRGVERSGDSLLAETSTGTIAARTVLLALGRRGTPRRLGVPGEESAKVLYQLIDAATYERERVLVVGGGDSAIEAATALADHGENDVTLSYRRDAFFRLKARNAERVARFADEGRLKILFRSNVERIDDDSVTLAIDENGATKSTLLPNDYVFVFAGGEPPYPLLREIGVSFGGEEAAAAEYFVRTRS